MTATLDDPEIQRVLEREHQAARAQRDDRRGDHKDRQRLDDLRQDGQRLDGQRLDDQQPAPRRSRSFKDAEHYQQAYLSIGPAQGALLYFLARASGAKRLVEFGSSFGISTLYLAAAAADNGGRVIGSEFYANKREHAIANLEQAGLTDIVEIRLGDATQTLAEIDEPIDFVFLDGEKALYQPVLEMLEDKLAAGAWVIADNLDHLSGEPGDFRHFILNQPERYTTRLMPVGEGLFSVSRWRVGDAPSNARVGARDGGAEDGGERDGGERDTATGDTSIA